MSADGNKILVSVRVYDDEGLWNMEIGGDPRNRARTRTSSNNVDPETNNTVGSAVKRESIKRNSFYGGSSPLKSPTKADENRNTFSTVSDPIGMTSKSIQIAIQHLLIMPALGITISFLFEDVYGREFEEKYNSPHDAVQDLQSRQRAMTPQLKGRLRDLQAQFAQCSADETEIFQEMTMIKMLSDKIRNVSKMKEQLTDAANELAELSVSSQNDVS